MSEINYYKIFDLSKFSNDIYKNIEDIIPESDRILFDSSEKIPFHENLMLLSLVKEQCAHINNIIIDLKEKLEILAKFSTIFSSLIKTYELKYKKNNPIYENPEKFIKHYCDVKKDNDVWNFYFTDIDSNLAFNIFKFFSEKGFIFYVSETDENLIIINPENENDISFHPNLKNEILKKLFFNDLFLEEKKKIIKKYQITYENNPTYYCYYIDYKNFIDNIKLELNILPGLIKKMEITAAISFKHVKKIGEYYAKNYENSLKETLDKIIGSEKKDQNGDPVYSMKELYHQFLNIVFKK